MTIRNDEGAGRAPGRSTRLLVQSLTKRYGDLLALDDLSLTVEPGAFQALLGPSGSGKTSLLMSIAGFLRPDSGQILVNGADVVHLPPERRNFGMVFQGYALFPHLSVLDNVAFALRARGIGLQERRKRAGAAIDLVRLTGREDHYPRQLSGGQQQRVALARAIAFQPDLLLLDEPLSALDRALRSELQTELRSLQKTTGLTCVYVTHDQDEALSMADVVAVLTAGRIVQIGSPVDLYERPASRFVASFLGKSNFLELERAGRDGDVVVGRRGDTVVRHRGVSDGDTEGSLLLTLRPEKIALADAPEMPGHNVVRARVLDVSYLGSAIEMIADAGPLGRMIVRAPASDIARVDQGRDIGLAWREDATVAIKPDA
ncbi:ABC transporter ATP-binding protein [Aquabacter sp. CN5-332]|uniref:ABC transporter ATP-binding protein n=1 Tax=Aquabacter sp. CN5-332 TaxID=3156608 RepID=UPI0032B464B9